MGACCGKADPRAVAGEIDMPGVDYKTISEPLKRFEAYFPFSKTHINVFYQRIHGGENK